MDESKDVGKTEDDVGAQNNKMESDADPPVTKGTKRPSSPLETDAEAVKKSKLDKTEAEGSKEGEESEGTQKDSVQQQDDDAEMSEEETNVKGEASCREETSKMDVDSASVADKAAEETGVSDDQKGDDTRGCDAGAESGSGKESKDGTGDSNKESEVEDLSAKNTDQIADTNTTGKTDPVDSEKSENSQSTNGESNGESSKSNDVIKMNGEQEPRVEAGDVPTDLSTKPPKVEEKEVAKGKFKNDDASVHSEDSEKENLNNDMPMDLSTKSSGSGNAPDVIMLSDEEPDLDDRLRLNGDRELSVSELKMRRKFIKRLQAELRNEEAKLVLLKKLRQSQMSHQLQEQNTTNNSSGSSTANGPSVNNSKSLSAPSRQQSQPPPLIRGSQQQMQQARPAHSQLPQLMRGSQSSSHKQSKSQGPPPLVMAPRMDNRHLMQNHMGRMVQNNTSNLMSGFRASQSVQHLQQVQQAAAQQRVVEETPAQRQAAAKLALRKQLEKTLLQIPPPKPPPPEMNFIPSLASPDFIYLLGLEEAVNFIIDANLISKGRKNPDEKMVCNPFTCVQCGSDFTPVWKREKPGSKHVICEQCVTTNQKKALKQEHTNRLKSAFVKALQQEQEIERMQSQEVKATPPAPPPPPAPVTTTVSHSLSSSALASSYKQQASMAETIRQHQNLLHAHQAASLRMGQPLGLQAFNPRNPFPYQLPFGARPSDLQRQYLLDMIPKGGLPWTS